MSTRARRARLLAGALCAVVIIGACGGGKSSKSDRASSTSSTVGDGTSATNADGSPASGSSGATGKTTTTKKGSGSTKSSAHVPRFGAPKAGTYKYTTQYTSGTNAPKTIETDLAVEDGNGNGTAFPQVVSYAVGNDIKRWEYVWDAGGRKVAYEQEKIGDNAQTALCAWSPMYRDVPVPITDNGTWSAHATCNANGTPKTRDLAVTVVGREAIDIGGTRVETFKLHWVEDTSVPVSNLKATDHIDRTDWYDPSRNLVVQSNGTETKSLDNVPRSVTRMDSKLRSVTPS